MLPVLHPAGARPFGHVPDALALLLPSSSDGADGRRSRAEEGRSPLRAGHSMSRKDQAEIRRTGEHYDRIAGQYDDQVDGIPLNRAMREAFRQRVAVLVQPGGTILDFGCGTGIDAAWYAARGYRVIAYDISPAMVDVLRARCEDDIAQGH